MDSKEAQRRQTEHHCRVCGLDWGFTRAEMDHDFCPCCRCHVAYYDFTPEGARKFREAWLNKGAPWDLEKIKPANWGPEMLAEQLKNIPEDFK